MYLMEPLNAGTAQANKGKLKYFVGQLSLIETQEVLIFFFKYLLRGRSSQVTEFTVILSL
jgi:hypothetical protein